MAYNISEIINSISFYLEIITALLFVIAWFSTLKFFLSIHKNKLNLIKKEIILENFTETSDFSLKRHRKFTYLIVIYILIAVFYFIVTSYQRIFLRTLLKNKLNIVSINNESIKNNKFITDFSDFRYSVTMKQSLAQYKIHVSLKTNYKEYNFIFHRNDNIKNRFLVTSDDIKFTGNIFVRTNTLDNY